MARLPRLFLPGCAQHVIQRGNNREACFCAEADTAGYRTKSSSYRLRPWHSGELHFYSPVLAHGNGLNIAFRDAVRFGFSGQYGETAGDYVGASPIHWATAAFRPVHIRIGPESDVFRRCGCGHGQARFETLDRGHDRRGG